MPKTRTKEQSRRSSQKYREKIKLDAEKYKEVKEQSRRYNKEYRKKIKLDAEKVKEENGKV